MAGGLSHFPPTDIMAVLMAASLAGFLLMLSSGVWGRDGL
jgi:hypothetical protein